MFDAPGTSATCTRRVRSDTPLQALTTLNDESFIEFAGGVAARVIKEAPGSEKERLQYAFILTVGRAPKPEEAERLARYLAREHDDYTVESVACELS